MNCVGVNGLARIELHKPVDVDQSENEAFFAATHVLI